VVVSSNGIDWTLLTAAAPYQPLWYSSAVVWKDAIVVAGGMNTASTVNHITSLFLKINFSFVQYTHVHFFFVFFSI
jgi:hypothetical protein